MKPTIDPTQLECLDDQLGWVLRNGNLSPERKDAIKRRRDEIRTEQDEDVQVDLMRRLLSQSH